MCHEAEARANEGRQGALEPAERAVGNVQLGEERRLRFGFGLALVDDEECAVRRDERPDVGEQAFGLEEAIGKAPRLERRRANDYEVWQVMHPDLQRTARVRATAEFLSEAFQIG